MTADKMFEIIYVNTTIVCEKLTDDELVGLNMVVSLGDDPKSRSWYGLVASLFTENDGTKMHSETAKALAHVVVDRLGG